MAPAPVIDFDDWLVQTFGRVGAFTMLIVLVEISEKSVALLGSSYLHVIGDEAKWPDMARLFAGAGAPWNGAAFFQADRQGLVDDATARRRLAALARHLEKDRAILNDGEFFDARGLRLRIDEVAKS
jgi:hypothetical protein